MTALESHGPHRARRRARCARAAAHATLLTLSLLAGGCAAARVQTNDVLVITTRVPDDPRQFVIQRCELRRDAPWVIESTAIGPTDTVPQPLALTQTGILVVMVDGPDGQSDTLRWLDRSGGAAAADSNAFAPGNTRPIPFDKVLDSRDGRLLLAGSAREQREPAMRVERGVIRRISPARRWLSVCDVDRRSYRRVLPTPVTPVARIGPFEWLVITPSPRPHLRLLDWRRGRTAAIAAWPAERRFAGAVVGPGRRWAVLAFQRVGRRWDLFDLVKWDRAAGTVEPLVQGVLVATRPRSGLSPTLPMRAINYRHLAFVSTIVTDSRGETPTDGTYQTAIADVETGRVICRFRHPRSGLRDEAPSPHLPAAQLAALRIEITAPPAAQNTAGSDGERWRRFLTFDADRLTTHAGTSYAPTELGLYSYSSDGAALAVRRRRARGGPDGDACIVFVGEREMRPLPLPGIERLTWLPRRSAQPAADD